MKRRIASSEKISELKESIMDHQKEKSTLVVVTCTVAENTYEITRRLPSNVFVGSHIALIVTNCFLLLLTISLNGISVMAIRKSTQLKNKICYFVILVQSAADLVVGILGIPLFIYCLLTPFLHSVNCTFVVLALGTTFIPSGMSIITLSALTLERYVAVLHPYSYKTFVTKKQILVFVLMGAIILCTIFGLSAIDRGIIRNFGHGTISVFIFSTAFVYIRIYRVIRKLVHSEKRPACENDGKDNLRRKQTLRDSKHAKSCFLVVICFGILLLPLTLSSLIFKIDSPEYKEYFFWCHTLVISNSSATSLLFFWTKKQLRKEALQNLRFFSR